MPVSERHAFQVVIERDEVGCFVAERLAFRACYAQGTTCAEALAHIRDVLQDSARQALERGELLPRPSDVISIERVEVVL